VKSNLFAEGIITRGNRAMRSMWRRRINATRWYWLVIGSLCIITSTRVIKKCASGGKVKYCKAVF